MEHILGSLASSDTVRIWLWAAFAVLATLYVLNQIALAYLTRRLRRLNREASGMPSWSPRRPPIWLTDWRRPKCPPHPGGLLNSEQSRELFRRFDLVKSLATVRTGKLDDPEAQRIIADLFSDLSRRDETQPALQWALKGQYRRALRYVIRLARWSERHYRPPPRGYMVAYKHLSVPIAPFALYSEAGALAHCLTDAEAARLFEKARSFAPKDISVLVVLSYLYAHAGRTEKLPEVTTSLLVALQHQLSSVEQGLKEGRYPGKESVDAHSEIRGLKARIDKTAQRLESMKP